MELACSVHGDVGREIRCLDSSRLGARINKLLVTFEHYGLNLKTRCCPTNCYLAWYLPLLNRTLYEAAMQLTEHSPGAFTMSIIPSVDVDVVRSDSSFIEAAILLYWLLKHHRCIRILVLGIKAFPVSCFPALLSEALLANKGLVEVQAHPVNDTESWRKARECSVLAAALGKLSPRLESLDVTSLIMDGDSAEAIASTIRRGNLRRLVLYTRMPVTVAKKLFWASTASTSLSSLEIAGFSEFSKSNAIILAAALKRNKILQKLSIMSIEGCAVGIILASLEDNDTLKELCFHYPMNPLGNTACRGLHPLRVNTGLSCVKLTGMSLGHSCAAVLADILNENSTLQELILSNNGIRNPGGCALANALGHNSSLRRFDVSNNQFVGPAVVQCFIDALAVNSTLECVYLGRVDVPEEWVPAWPPEGNVPARLHVTWNTRGLDNYAERLRGDDRLSHPYVGWIHDAASSGIVQWFSVAGAISASLTELTLEYDLSVDTASSAAIASFLEATGSLKKLVVRPAIYSHTSITNIINALALNKSVCNAEFHQHLHINRDIKAVQAVFRTNRTLHRLMFTECCLENKDTEILAYALENNFVLLKFEFKSFSLWDNMYPLLCILNRNRFFLNRAVECVLDPAADSHSVGALERLPVCDSLLDAVSDASGKTREESRCLVLDAVRRLNKSPNMTPSEPPKNRERAKKQL